MFRFAKRATLGVALSVFACSYPNRDLFDTAAGGEGGSEVGGGAGHVASGGAAHVAGASPSDAGASGAQTNAAAGGDAGGEQAPTAASPSVSELEPAEATLGDTVIVRGSHFIPSPTIRLGSGADIKVESATDDRLTFVVPSDLELESCTQVMPLVVRNENGSSEEVSFTIDQPPPSLTETSVVVAAGTHWSLKGESLAGASVALGATALSPTVGAADSIELNLPRSTPSGNTTLAVTTACGKTAIPVQILPPPPAVISADLTTLEPGAVILLKVDLSYGATIARVNVGATAIMPDDATSYRWVPGEDSGDTRQLAIRIPPGASTGDLDISLEGATAGEAFRVNLVSASPRAPGAATSIVLPPGVTNAEFPESTAGPFELADPANPKAPGGIPLTPWTYDIRVMQAGQNCTQTGTIMGTERHCPEPVQTSCSVGFVCPADADICNSFSGTYTIDQNKALVDLLIDRKSPDGPEEYVGSWSNPDGSAPNSRYPYLALRSKRSGRQLIIVHAMHSCMP